MQLFARAMLSARPRRHQATCRFLAGERALTSQGRFAPGDTVTAFGARARVTEPSRLTLQTGIDEHILLDPCELELLNHSCRPNLRIDFPEWRWVAVTPIAVGDELTFFYPSTEWSMAEPFGCGCGAAECLGTVTGAAGLPAAILARYQVAPHIRVLAARLRAV